MKQRHQSPDSVGSSSSALLWPPIARFIFQEQRIAAWAVSNGPVTHGIYEFLRFGVKQAWACLFGGLLLGLIIATHLWYPRDAAFARYDALVVGAVVLQLALVAFRLETLEELKVILIFHVAGTIMEIFKTYIGSWVYPEANILRIGGVPLFSGFMYAAIGSYIARAWRLFDFRFSHHPPLLAICLLSTTVYINFFTHHYIMDIRILLIVAAIFLFGPTVVYYRVWRTHRSMPLLLGFVLVAFFIWIAENIGTGMGAWLYPAQRRHWSMVPWSKLEAWFLLMIVSYTLTALINRPSHYIPDAAADPAGGDSLRSQTFCAAEPLP